MRLGTFSNSGLGFGLMFSLVDDFTYNARKIERQMQSLQGTSAALATSVEASMARAKLGAAGLLVSLVGLAGWGAAAKVDATFQNYELAFRSFLSSAEEAHNTFEQIKRDAIANPKFSIAGMEKANLLLISQGVSAKESMQAIRDLSTILLGVGRGEPELQRVALAFEKIQAAGFLTGPQFRSLTTAGLPVVRMLKAIGVNLDPSKIAKAKISFDTLMKAMHNAVNDPAQFGRVWMMMADNVSAKAAQLKENWQATLGDIGKAIRPATLVILNFLGSVIGKIQAFAATDTGKWILRLVFALNVLLFGLSALVLVSSLFRVAFLKLASIFPAATKATIASTMATRGWGAALGVVMKSVGGLIKSFAPLLVKLGLFYAGWKLVESTDSAFLYAIGTALMFVMGPLGLIAGIMTFVSRSFREFGRVMDGSAKPAQGLIGIFQRLGAALTFVGAAWRGFNGETGEIEISKNLMQSMDYLGMGTFARHAATWIARIHAMWDGMIEGFKETWAWFKRTVVEIANIFQPLDKQFGSWNDLIGKNSDAMELWKSRGKTFGAVILGILGLVIADMLLMRGIMIVNGIVGAMSFLAWAAPILIVTGLILIIGDLLSQIATALFGTSDAATSAFGGIGEAASSMASSLGILSPQFGEVGKAWGSSLIDGMRTSMGDWWENFSSIDFGNKWLWGDKEYHYVPFNSARSGWKDPVAARNSEVLQSGSGRALQTSIASSGGFFNPLGGAVGMMQYQGQLATVLANQLKANTKASQPILNVNLQVDKQTIAKVVIDTAKHSAATGYGNVIDNQLNDTSYQSQPWMNATPEGL